jgi:hypothetical protein
MIANEQNSGKMEFNFNLAQLDKPLSAVFQLRTYEDVGLTKRLYKLCELIDENYNTSWNQSINTSIINYLGFETIEEFKNNYARAILYNALRYNASQTLRGYISMTSLKIERHHGRHVSIKRKSENLNVLDILLSFTTDELFCLGW